MDIRESFNDLIAKPLKRKIFQARFDPRRNVFLRSACTVWEDDNLHSDLPHPENECAKAMTEEASGIIVSQSSRGYPGES